MAFSFNPRVDFALRIFNACHISAVEETARQEWIRSFPGQICAIVQRFAQSQETSELRSRILAALAEDPVSSQSTIERIAREVLGLNRDNALSAPPSPSENLPFEDDDDPYLASGWEGDLDGAGELQETASDDVNEHTPLDPLNRNRIRAPHPEDAQKMLDQS